VFKPAAVKLFFCRHFTRQLIFSSSNFAASKNIPLQIYEFKQLLKMLLCMGVALSVHAEETTYQWTGAYAGVNLGSDWSGSQFAANNVSFLPDSGTYKSSISGVAVNPGLQLGYLKQFQTNWVLGAEGDFSYPASRSNFQQSDSLGEFDRFTLKNNLQGSLRLRAGYAIQRFLPFITAGVSFASVGLTYNNENSQETYSRTTTQTGWVLGGGLEYGVLTNLSVRTEYLYTDYGKALNLNIPTIGGYTDSTGGAQATLYSHVIRAAVNYRF
jgi:opacity protein-like surface antigen